MLTTTFSWLRQWIGEADADAAESAAAGADEAGKIEDYGPDPEDARYRQLLQILLPIEPALLDLQQIKRVLSGNQTPSPAEQVRWSVILKLAMENASTRNHGLDEAIAVSTAAQGAVLASLAQDPVRLAVLHRTASLFEEAVAKRIRRLATSR